MSRLLFLLLAYVTALGSQATGSGALAASAAAGSAPNPIAGFYSSAPPSLQLWEFSQYAIPIVNEAYCRHYLEELFPSLTLQEGLANLRAANTAISGQRECAENLLAGWDQVLGPLPAPPWATEPPGNFPSCPANHGQDPQKRCYLMNASGIGGDMRMHTDCPPTHLVAPMEYFHAVQCFLPAAPPAPRSGTSVVYHWLRESGPSTATVPSSYLQEAALYLQKRILGDFTNELRRGGAKDPAGFCANFSRRQERAMDYLRAMLSAPAAQQLPYSIQRARSGTIAFGLDEVEFAAIQNYMGSYFQVINPAIWKQALDPHMEAYISIAREGLERLPTFHGKVLRMTTLPEAVIQSHQLGQIVTYDAFTSTSRNPDFTWSGKHRFLIYAGKSGRHVAPVMYGNITTSEDEVLFPPGARFKVLSRVERPEGRIDFVLAEVDENGNVIHAPPPTPTVPLVLNPF